MRTNLISHGEQIAADLFPGSGPAKQHAFLFLHGFPYGHPNHDAAKGLADLGFTCMTYFMAGNKPSEGDIDKVTIKRSLEDAQTAYELLRGYVGATALIGVVGNSFGSYIATLLTREKKVDCLSLRVPANYPDECIEKPLNPLLQADEIRKWRNRRDATPENNRALAALHDFGGAVQIIRAAEDEDIPKEIVEDYVAVVPEARREYMVTSTGHSLSATPGAGERYTRLLADWAIREEARAKGLALPTIE